jgi:tape measure domain-containing protein
MANIVEYLVKIRDLASGQMRNIGNATDNTMTRISSRVNRVSSNVTSLNSRIDALSRTRDISLDLRQIRRANTEIASLEQRRDRLTNSGGSGGGSMLMSGLLVGGIALAGAGLITSMKAGMERQMASTSFDVMAGKAPGAKLHNNLMGFATDTIYGNEVFAEAQTMLGFGIAAKNIMPSMRMLGDVAMGNAERMKSLSLVFAQTSAAGKLTGQDMLQYVSAGFNPLQAISEKTGRSMIQLKDDMSKGKISFKDVAGAFEYATGPMGRFHNGMKKMGETPTGKWMAFTGALGAFAGTVGVALLPVLGGVTSILSGLMSNVPVMYAIAAGIGAMTLAWGAYTLWTQRAAIWQGILAAIAYWPVALIGLVVGAVVWVVKAFDGWGKSINGLWEITKAFTSRMGLAFKDFFQTIVFYGELFWLNIKNIFQNVGGLISNVGNAMKLALSGDFAGAKKALTMEIKTDASGEIDRLKKAREEQKASNMAEIAGKTGVINKAWSQVGLTRSKTAGNGAMDWMTSKLDFTNGPGGKGAPAGVADSAKGIAGGGVRNVTINIAKQGVDNITIHTTNLREGAGEIQQLFIELFNQVVNSGGSILPAN